MAKEFKSFFKESQTEARRVLGSSAREKVAEAKPPARLVRAAPVPASVAKKASEKGRSGGLLVRGLPDDMIARLERERERRGLRSRNDVAVSILDKGVPK